MYTPYTFKKVKDKKTGKWRNLTDQEKRQQVWNLITRDSILGGTALGVGGALSGIADAEAQQLNNAANISASTEQRNVFGPTMTDRAAAGAAPMLKARARLYQTVSAIINGLLQQNVADRRASFLQAIQDASYNNMGMSGQYADARRKLYDQYNPTGGIQ